MLKEALQKPLRWIAPSGKAQDVVEEPADAAEDLYQGKYAYLTRHYSPNRQTRRVMGLRRRPRRMRLARLAGKVA